MALVALSVVERRLDAVRAVLAGAAVTEIAASVGVSRQTVHVWVGRYLAEGVSGLADRSHRPVSCPHRVGPDVEVVVAEMRRAHPRWGAKRIRMQLLRRPLEDVVVPSTATINRILTRQGLVRPRPRKRPRDSYVRWQRPGPMQLWGVDIVGGIWLINPATGARREAKVVTGVDDHSRFCVMAAVVERATSRAVCLAFAQALARFGVPEEVLSDNGKQFTDRFGKGGEVLFDKICRKNGITHRLTQPASPNQNGKVERFHGTFRPDFLDQAEAFTSVAQAQAAVDAWVADYNTDRPHQALDDTLPVTPAERFVPVENQQRTLIDLWLPPAVAACPAPASAACGQSTGAAVTAADEPAAGWTGGPIAFDRVVPPSGNLMVAGKQFWLGPARAGITVSFWADTDVIHLSAAGGRIKSLRSHLTVNDLARLVRAGAVPAGPPPLPAPDHTDAIEVDRTVSAAGTVSLGQHIVLAAEILAGRRVGIRIEPTTLMMFDLDTRELLRTRPNPLTTAEVGRLRAARKAGPPPRPSLEPVRVQRRASNTGVVMVCGQKIALGRAHRHQTLTIAVSDTTLAIDLDDGDTKIVRRTTTQPVRNIKADRPRAVPQIS
ncbi:IS481 family transposase [Actinocatenispora sera]|uniref:Integrase catalytic domain-containing protein n=1 Tax=Actinocatenispora sera TaxID=390989 RepID=A0A810L6B5_9ACTN|nr:IS481 family transposase [Actinocatenispora sera]BCJ29585.1 hypothetical protein Asera_36930 [Actinocatenispora sera]BCJ29628.1 hypothetical protein Asera_37360 [Actinocatenispora sera]BCJ29648.1 hypothetical protein Asera_37560 [Actinocatenispora sera]BCJ29668.1 hypothetical protein Asera_37760 [Actinocatenispora sera]